MKTLPLFAFVALTAVAAGAVASPIVAGFNQSSLGRIDDGYAFVALPTGFTADLTGYTYSSLYVNNNGSVSFGSQVGNYEPLSFASNNYGATFFAPLLADVDTRVAPSGVVSYGFGQYDGHAAFGVNWPGVGYYNEHTDKLDSFQLILVDRADTGVGNVDIYYNYGAIKWDKGDVSSTSARAGYSQLGNLPDYEFAGSGQSGQLLDGGIHSLSAGSNIGVAGSYEFSARNGVITAGLPPSPSGEVPLPGSLSLFGIGAAAMIARRRQQATRQRG
ncbi:MAG TPA: nidogen-like domain-containing protein [Telluria sp.]|nr:nidogen-like domain-containing protein [Telluria sp.]